MSYQRLETDDLPVPISSKHSASSWMARASPKTRCTTFIAIAAASGVLLLLVGFGTNTTGRPLIPEAKDWRGPRPKPTSPTHSFTTDIDTHLPPSIAKPSAPVDCSTETPRPFVRPGLGQYVMPLEDEWTLDRVRNMVSKTKGYYVRDYSLGLGWNNVGGSIPQGVLTHSAWFADAIHYRGQPVTCSSSQPDVGTPFICLCPCLRAQYVCRQESTNSSGFSDLYFSTVCAGFATMVNRGDAIGWDEWRHLPIEKQM